MCAFGCGEKCSPTSPSLSSRLEELEDVQLILRTRDRNVQLLNKPAVHASELLRSLPKDGFVDGRCIYEESDDVSLSALERFSSAYLKLPLDRLLGADQVENFLPEVANLPEPSRRRLPLRSCSPVGASMTSSTFETTAAASF